MNRIETSVMVSVHRVLAVVLLAGGLALSGCEPPNPEANTPTSGRLILFVDEIYAPLVRALADTFMVRSPNSKIEIHSVPARGAIEEVITAQVNRAVRSDTTATIAAIIGRRLLADEIEVIQSGKLDLKEYTIGHDGIALAVATGVPLESTNLDWVTRAMRPPEGATPLLDSAQQTPMPFILPDQNSSTFMVARARLLGDSNITAPVRYYSSSDSVIEQAAAGNGVAVIGWYRAHRDSARLKTLRMGYTDSAGVYTAPVRVHPTTLVTNTYPLKQPLIGYTFAPVNSLAVGFLAWISRSQDAQFYLTHQGLQGENVKYQLNLPESAGE